MVLESPGGAAELLHWLQTQGMLPQHEDGPHVTSSWLFLEGVLELERHQKSFQSCLALQLAPSPGFSCVALLSLAAIFGSTFDDHRRGMRERE